MRQLLSANFARLWRSLWFWLGGLGMLGYSLWEKTALLSWVLGPDSGYQTDYLSNRVADFAVPLLLIMAVLCPLYLNTDYHDGTIRNKVMVGRTRVQVYLANYLTMLAAALMYAAVHVILSFAAVLFVRSHVWVPGDTLEKLLLGLAYILAVTALFTLWSMLVQVRAVSVAAVLMAAGLLWLAQHMFFLLCQSKEVPDFDQITMSETPDENGNFDPIYWKDGQRLREDQLEMIPNPKYVDYPLRGVYLFMLEALPGGQAFLISDSLAPVEGSSTNGMLALYSLGLFALATAAGLAVFRRMDLK